MKRKGLGKGTGKGYKNIINQDPVVHSMSARGLKQKSQMNPVPIKSEKLSSYNIGDIVYLKKTGEKFRIIGKRDGEFEIEDMGGTAFYGIDKSEFKKKLC